MSEAHMPEIIAGEVAILARRYAQALIELAEEKEQLEPVEADLVALEEAVIRDADFQRVASHPRLDKNELLKFVKAVGEAAKFCDLTTAFLLQVSRNNRLSMLTHIVAAFCVMLAEKRGEYTAFVKVSRALNDAQRDALIAQLGKMTGGTVKIVVEEDPSLLGGMTVKLGSRLIDASVKGRLASIARQLNMQQEAA